MQKKVGLVTCYFMNNYGSLLQAYATQQFLDNNNIENETIDVSNLIDFKKGKRKFYKSQITNFSFVKTKFGRAKLLIHKKINKTLRKNISIRNKMFDEYKRNFNLTGIYPTYEIIGKIAEKRYSDVIVGSDQLWLPLNVVADYYTLNWVPDSVNKISYSTSFGVSTVESKYEGKYISFLNRINHLSTREKSGVELIKKLTNIDAKLVCDPTLLLTKDEWEQHSIKERIIEDKYIFCYFLGNNVEHRKFVERLKEKTGYKIVSINHSDEYVKYSDKFADITPYNVGPKEWINMIKNAEYVCTDSFHATVFSILFNRYFFDFRRFSQKNKNNTNSRLDSLLNIAGISTERILNGNESIDKVTNYKIDYKKVDKNIEKVRNDSKKWLLNSLEYKEEKGKEKYIKIERKEDCTGCSSCVNSCPQNAIGMVRDEEGFLYPEVNEDKCINCGICKKSCPMINNKKNIANNQKVFVFQHKDNKVRKESTSGGAFTAIAEYITKNDGIVYGVAFDDNFNVIHTRVDNINELYKFRNSKYVQSDPNNTFSQVKDDLNNNKLVLYSGTSCQISGLRSYLKKDYENLILVDVVCRAVPSPLVWKKYLSLRESQLGKIDKAFFREKVYGYKYSNLTMYSKRKRYKAGIDSDPYLRAFFQTSMTGRHVTSVSIKRRIGKVI